MVKKVWEESKKKKKAILIVVGFPDPPRMIIFQQSKFAFDFFLFFCLKWWNRNLKCVQYFLRDNKNLQQEQMFQGQTIID